MGGGVRYQMINNTRGGLEKAWNEEEDGTGKGNVHDKAMAQRAESRHLWARKKGRTEDTATKRCGWATAGRLNRRRERVARGRRTLASSERLHPR